MRVKKNLNQARWLLLGKILRAELIHRGNEGIHTAHRLPTITVGLPFVKARVGVQSGHQNQRQSCGDQRQQLSSLQAPDFTLPDLQGKPHRLSDFHGKKILLVTWASW